MKLLTSSICLAVAGGGATVKAQSTYFWDTNKTAVGIGGTGNWSGAIADNFWTPDGATAHVLWNATAPVNSIAEFGGTAGTVSLTGSYDAYALHFSSGGYLLQTGSSSNRTITLTTGIVQTDSGTTTVGTGNGGTVIFSGAAGFTKQGDGTLILGTSINTYTGATVVSAGSLKLGVTNSLRTNDSLTVASGATLDLNGYSQSTTEGTLSGSGSITDSTGAGGTFSFGSTTNSEFSGTLSGSMNYAKNGGSSSTLILSGGSENTFTGVTSVTAGTLALQKSGGVTAISGHLSIGDGTGTDTLLLSASNQIANTSAVSLQSGGVFDVAGHAETIGSLSGVSGAAVSLNGGTFTIGGNATTNYAGTVNLGSGGTLTISGSNDATLSGVVSNSGGITKEGDGTLTLSATNTYNGTTTISGGILSVGTLAASGTSGPLGNTTAAAANLVINGGTLRYTGAGHSTNRLFTIGSNGATVQSNGSGAMSFTSTGSLAFSGSGPRLLSLSGSNTEENTFRPVIGDNAGDATSLQKSGPGKWILSGSNTYTGGTLVGGGTLVTSAASALGSGTVHINGGILQSSIASLNTGAMTISSGSLQLNGTSGGTVILAPGANFSMSGGIWNLNLASAVDQILGSAGGSFSISGGTFDLGGGSIDYSNLTVYTLLSGFTPGTISGLTFTNYNPSFAPTLGTNGVLTFSAIPEPTNLLGGILVALGLFRRRRKELKRGSA